MAARQGKDQGKEKACHLFLGEKEKAGH